MLYFAYGSNMSSARLQQRVPSAVSLGMHKLAGYDLRFHKIGKEGSGKGDAYQTSDPADQIYGVLFDINESEKPALDRAEGLGHGYQERTVEVIAADGTVKKALTYIAIAIDKSLKPYSWYLNHVLIGATEAGLPDDYIEEKIKAIETVEDKDKARDQKQRAIHSKHVN